ncbi:MAG: 50S ribosomal protein L3 [Betaproteobacteria bacterium]|nr:50S ribosomal protein L3 [Betaproteobacteria bacterium]
MSLGLVGRKVGMTRVFGDDGASTPVTVLDLSNNRVIGTRTPDVNGYSAVQVAFGERRASRVIKPIAGQYAKAGVEAGRGIHEFHIDAAILADFAPGKPLSVEIFAVGQKVDVTGTSQGKGFSGPIKRHNFSSNRASHGNSISHNSPGSIGMAQDPGRVFPGKRMAGHLGAAKRTTLNLEVVRVDAERQLLLVKGAVPGSKGSDVVVRPAVKGGA